jgi:uncharacterized membrane protein
MTGGEIHQVSAELGRLKNAVEMMTDTWRAQERAATDGRRALHDKFDELKTEMTETRGRVGQMSNELAEIKPAIKRFEAQRQRQEGASSAMKVIWGAVVVFATGLGYAGHELMMYFWPPKH